ncbi:MAG: riboflavin synthase, partial [Gammaproteobacteria bacterium]|nr:riboflavin synthase [Gammaproteobacteria bacterium]
SWRFVIRVPKELARYIAPKGSITINGVSLTVNSVNDDQFDVNIVPHTLQCTTMNDLEVGTAVNLEIDLLARYLEKLLTSSDNSDYGVSKDLLQKSGFWK